MSAPLYKHLHEAWHIHARAPAQVRHILRDSDENLGSGSFSTVIGVDERTVLKISTCQASRIILPRLMQRPEQGLPIVFKCFGQVGHVEQSRYYDDIPLHAYLLERLRPVELVSERTLRTDVCPRGSQMCAKTPADAVGAYNWLERKLWDAASLAELDNGGAQQVHPLVPAFERTLTGTRFSPLIGAVRKLAARVDAGEWKFDVIHHFTQNVLVSDWGEPILADPVFDTRQPLWKPAWFDDGYGW